MDTSEEVSRVVRETIDGHEQGMTLEFFPVR